MTVKFIQRYLSLNLKSLGELIGRYPIYFIILPCILSAVLSTGFMRMKYDRNYSKLFTAEKSRTVKSRAIVEALFPTNTSSNLDLFRIIDESKGILIVITPIKGNNMLTNDIMQELQFIDNMIKNLTVYYEGNIVNYNLVCGKREGKCLDNPVLKLVPHMKKFEKGRYKFKYPIDIDMFTYLYTRYIANLGGVKVDENRYVQSAEAIRLLYPFDTNNKTMQHWIEKWELLVVDYLSQVKFQHISISAAGMKKVTEDFSESTRTLIPLISVLVIIVTTFSSISCMTNSWLRSKPWLGVAASISSGLAVVASFGSLFHCGYQTTDINVTLPFLIFATEIDDAYLLVASWRRTSSKENVEKRMGRAYSEAAVSITITSLTNFLSFSVGMITPFPVVRIFCLYAAVSIFFSYVYQIIFFGGCMALSGYRESHNLSPLTFRKIADVKELLSTCESSMDVKKECMMEFFESTFCNFVSSGPVKLFIILAFIANLSIGIWGVSQMKDGMDVVHLLNSQSTTRRMLEDMLKYFGQYPYPLHIVINKTLNYADPETQSTVEGIIKKIEDNPHITEPFLTLSWLKYYKQFQLHPISKFSLSSYNVSNKQDFIDGLREVFLGFTGAKQFKNDIVFNENFTEITASRFIVGCKDLYDRKSEIKLLKDLREIVAQSPLPITIHTFPFPLLEHALLIRGIVFQLGWVIGLLILIVFFFFIPNIVCAVCVSLSVVSSICQTVGYMTLWGVGLDMISILLLILGAGFSINYPTHITYSFLMANSQTTNGKLRQSLYEVGWPIVQGSVSTVLGVIILPFQETYVYVCFFKVVFLIAAQTAFHAMLVLPVVLSFISRWKKPNDICNFRTYFRRFNEDGVNSKQEICFKQDVKREEQGYSLVKEKSMS